MTSFASDELAELVEFAEELADIAARETVPMFRTNIAIDNKSRKAQFDPVTAADRAAERAIRDHIAAHHPEHSVRGEEMDDYAGSSPLTWVLDPIDGTKAFIVGIPVWATLIGLLDRGAPRIGVMDQPFIGERFVGTPQGSYVQGPLGARRLQTRELTRLEDAVLATSDPHNFHDPWASARFHALRERVTLSRYGGDSYFYCLLAAGQIDIVTDPGLDDYDIVALVPIIENAGGIVTTWDGGSPVNGGTIVATANAALHETVLDLLAG